MEHLIQFSGGKDSTATAIWCKNQGIPAKLVFCDTGWEHEWTYHFIEEFSNKIGLELITLQSEKYVDLPTMAAKKKRFPSSQARFCTAKLKVEPFIDYLLSIEDDVTTYQGIRWEESPNRAKLDKRDDYFSGYHNGQYSYKKRKVLAQSAQYDTALVRPIIDKSGAEVMSYIKEHGYEWNPLYDLGFGRVGCFPCIMARHAEVALMIEFFPERIETIRKLEQELDSTFFPPNYIPIRYCSKAVKKETEGKVKVVKVPRIDDVVRYIKSRRMKQTKLFTSTCRNVYVPCE